VSGPRRAGVAAAALVLGTVLALLLGFSGPTLGPTTTGDAALAADVSGAFDGERGLEAVSAARVEDGRATFAGLGETRGTAPGPDTPFELGSITKTFTAALLAEALERGEVRLDDPVSGQLTELVGSDAGASTYRELATHTAGLPAFPSSSVPLVLLRLLGNDNPYGGSVAELLAATRTTEVGGRGTYAYSNLGVALLGHALARAAGVPDWPTLVQQRLLDPLGMRRTVVAAGPDEVPAHAAPPHHDNGWRAPFWSGAAFAPAGSSTTTTASDLARFAGAVLDGTAPGASATDPVADIPGGRIGLLWHVRQVDGRTITWHNGGTGGTRTILALDRERGRAVVLLQSSARDLDTTGLRLAAAEPGAPPLTVDGPDLDWAGTASWGVLGLLLVATAVGRWRRSDRWALPDGAASAAAGLLVLLAHGPWLVVPVAVWGGLALATLALGVLAARSTRTGAPLTGRRAALTASGTVLVLALALWSL